MSTGPLPEKVDHKKLASDNAILEGSIPTTRFERLKESLESDTGYFQCHAEFVRGARGRDKVIGRARGRVTMICQACMGRVDLPLEVEIDLTLVNSEERLLALDLSEDGLVAESKLLMVSDLFEDELILHLPMAPRHLDGECSEVTEIPLVPLVKEDTVVAGEVETHQPFAGLRKLQEDLGAGK